MHGLIQAFSRTNRILNSIKTFGNIVCFRALQKRTDAAIALFGDKDAGGIVTLRSFDDYYNGFEDYKGNHIDGYVDLIDRLLTDYPLTEPKITGEENQKALSSSYHMLVRITSAIF